MSSATAAEGTDSRRARLIGKGWIQGVALVMLFGFTVMGLLAYRTYTNSMPQPQKVVTESGETLFTTQDITEGQKGHRCALQTRWQILRVTHCTAVSQIYGGDGDKISRSGVDVAGLKLYQPSLIRKHDND